MFFFSVAKGLSKNTVMHVLSTRRKIFNALESYLVNQIPQDPNRLGDLTFFILSPLQVFEKYSFFSIFLFSLKVMVSSY